MQALNYVCVPMWVLGVDHSYSYIISWCSCENFKAISSMSFLSLMVIACLMLIRGSSAGT